MKSELPAMRYPSTPLIVHDPYFSIWSASDKLNESWPCHWTGVGNALCGILRVDGLSYRFAGDFRASTEKARQLSVEVLPTRTIYMFEAGAARLKLSFVTPALPEDLDVLSRPVSYVEFELSAREGSSPEAELYFDVGAEACADNSSQSVAWGRLRGREMEVLTAACSDQRPLGRSGDNLRIDWGSLCLAIPSDFEAASAAGPQQEIRSSFAKTGRLPDSDSFETPCKIHGKWPVLAASFKLGKLGRKPVSRHLLVAYNDLWSAEYLDQRLKGYWARKGQSFAQMLAAAKTDFEALKKRCAAFDDALLESCREAGGAKYAKVCALAYRQAIGAHKLVASADGVPFFLSKENFSNGCIATVDVTYPSAPLFLLLQPELLKGMMLPIMDYALKARWKFPFAPHDLGTYPLANGQVYGGGENDEENQMPVEECGNMLLLAGALLLLCEETPFVRQYWPLLSRWAEYLREKGYDPESQLCTDDFAGHLAHNANLSLKAILALGAYGKMAEKLGEKGKAAEFLALAAKHAKRWLKDAASQSPSRLAFDLLDSWSQKYNLVWDRLLKLNLFPEKLGEDECAFYRSKQGPYGVPLDNRKSYAKLDWTYWSATLSGSDEDFAALTEPLFKWLDETPTRVPMCDWYDTESGKQSGFQARSVVGGIFLKLLYDEKLRKRWLPGKAKS